jgi:predicted neuraminidase
LDLASFEPVLDQALAPDAMLCTDGGAADPDVREVSPARELRPEEIAAAMDGVLRPHETEPDRIDAFLPSPCVQNHAANLAFLGDGLLACVWFGGTMEGMGDISVWMSRLPAGAGRWGQATRLTDDPERSEQNPNPVSGA